MENNNNKSICKHKVTFFALNSPPLTLDVTCSKLLRYTEYIGDKKLSVEHTRYYTKTS